MHRLNSSLRNLLLGINLRRHQGSELEYQAFLPRFLSLQMNLKSNLEYQVRFRMRHQYICRPHPLTKMLTQLYSISPKWPQTKSMISGRKP
jgi:hypothetical protein